MMTTRPFKLVADAEVWEHMDGDNDLEKKLNSYLTCQFIIRNDVPSDECLDEAREIIKIVESSLKVGAPNEKKNRICK